MLIFGSENGRDLRREREERKKNRASRNEEETDPGGFNGRRMQMNLPISFTLTSRLITNSLHKIGNK